MTRERVLTAVLSTHIMIITSIYSSPPPLFLWAGADQTINTNPSLSSLSISVVCISLSPCPSPVFQKPRSFFNFIYLYISLQQHPSSSSCLPWRKNCFHLHLGNLRLTGLFILIVHFIDALPPRHLCSCGPSS